MDSDDEEVIKYSMKAIVAYTEGSYFGDSDIFAKTFDLNRSNSGRDG